MTILFCNVGWMERYQGLRSGDQIIGGGAYVKQERRGGEVCNFSPYKNELYGYVQTPGGGCININRIGANKNDDSIDGVTVVWLARHPLKRTVIIGWYKDATVFRHYQEPITVPPAQSQNDIDGYWIKAPFASATLLPIDARVFEIPRGVEGGIGISNVWYADKPITAPLVERVRSMIENGGIPAVQVHRNAQDQEKKARVEKAAIRACCNHFENLGYDVESVEKDNVGWDLVAKSGQSGRYSLRIEVKGLSGTVFCIELTPNEYNAFKEQASDYRLAVVVNALESPSLSICRYSDEQGAWIIESDKDRAIEIKIKQSASITCI
jgi:Domain of unknown function (DUF3883)